LYSNDESVTLCLEGVPPQIEQSVLDGGAFKTNIPDPSMTGHLATVSHISSEDAVDQSIYRWLHIVYMSFSW
jgi:hypothetical protein